MGKCIIAVFDLDRTLTAERSLENTFFRYLLKSGKLRVENLIRVFIFFMKNIYKGSYEALKKNKMYLKGMSTALVISWTEDFIKAYSNTLISPKHFHFVKSHKDISVILVFFDCCPFCKASP